MTIVTDRRNGPDDARADRPDRHHRQPSSAVALVRRALLASADELVDALAEPDRRDRRRQKALDRWFAGFADQLRRHHELLDSMVVPALAAAGALDERRSTPSPPTTPGSTSCSATSATPSACCRSASAPRRGGSARRRTWPPPCTTCSPGQLSREERLLTPLVARWLDADERDVVQRETMRAVATGPVRFSLAWLYTHLDDAERAAVDRLRPGGQPPVVARSPHGVRADRPSPPSADRSHSAGSVSGGIRLGFRDDPARHRVRIPPRWRDPRERPDGLAHYRVRADGRPARCPSPSPRRCWPGSACRWPPSGWPPRPTRPSPPADELGFPVVAKLNGDAIAHKTERGLVRLGLADAAAVRQAADRAAGRGDARRRRRRRARRADDPRQPRADRRRAPRPPVRADRDARRRRHPRRGRRRRRVPAGAGRRRHGPRDDRPAGHPAPARAFRGEAAVDRDALADDPRRPRAGRRRAARRRRASTSTR